MGAVAHHKLQVCLKTGHGCVQEQCILQQGRILPCRSSHSIRFVVVGRAVTSRSTCSHLLLAQAWCSARSELQAAPAGTCCAAQVLAGSCSAIQGCSAAGPQRACAPSGLPRWLTAAAAPQLNLSSVSLVRSRYSKRSFKPDLITELLNLLARWKSTLLRRFLEDRPKPSQVSASTRSFPQPVCNLCLSVRGPRDRANHDACHEGFTYAA